MAPFLVTKDTIITWCCSWFLPLGSLKTSDHILHWQRSQPLILAFLLPFNTFSSRGAPLCSSRPVSPKLGRFFLLSVRGSRSLKRNRNENVFSTRRTTRQRTHRRRERRRMCFPYIFGAGTQIYWLNRRHRTWTLSFFVKWCAINFQDGFQKLHEKLSAICLAAMFLKINNSHRRLVPSGYCVFLN